ncbi:nucleotide-diphospho-sugar transferase [Dactylonectria estremocensis]|uniref:Nucleotide-diphospho-sugar transferase n=1 Tax=Dactylonectria estremocensis TaxID=1079267 RepID=A0A9P9IH42_9HYPO|nr:nucleotide-diphospho-sugar transferase [Dactylonectria estremocensis]
MHVVGPSRLPPTLCQAVMTTIWQSIGQLVTRTTTPTYKKVPYDEERLGWEITSRWRQLQMQHLRFPRLKRVVLILLVVDLTVFALLLRGFQPLITLLRRNEEMFGPRVHLSQHDIPESWQGQPHQPKIPRILHQTTPTNEIPEMWVELQKSCMDAYSDFEYKLWTDKLARDFISDEYPWFLQTWDSYPMPIQRADSIRYFVLHYYGGIYLDMDTWCNKTFPLHQVESDSAKHHAIFKSTLPTGVTNDFMISSAQHPIFTATIAKLPFFYAITRLWYKLLPYVAIMTSSGPFFLTLVIEGYLLEQPSLPSPTIAVINQTELSPYITDLESCSWHQGDAQTLMWVGERPWIWFAMGGVGLAIGLYVLNHLLLMGSRAIFCNKRRKQRHSAHL